MFTSPFFIYGAIFVATIVFVDAVFRFLGSRVKRKKETRNRLETLRDTEGADTAYKELLTRRGFGGRRREQSIASWINTMIGQSALEISTSRRVLYAILLWIAGFVIGTLFVSNNPYVLVGFSFVFLVVAAFMIIYVVRQRRMTAFTRQLPQAIDIVVRSLQAGHPLTSAIKLCAREMPDPIGSEFGILSDQLTFGSELDAGMLNMIDRVGVGELNLLAVTVSVQKGTGGNLSEILENLAQMIRDRLMIKAKIKAISAEGRITAWIMMLFPVFLFYMILFLVPTYYDKLWETGYGAYVVWGCLIMIFFGMMIIRKLINFDF